MFNLDITFNCLKGFILLLLILDYEWSEVTSGFTIMLIILYIFFLIDFKPLHIRSTYVAVNDRPFRNSTNRLYFSSSLYNQSVWVKTFFYVDRSYTNACFGTLGRIGKLIWMSCCMVLDTIYRFYQHCKFPVNCIRLDRLGWSGRIMETRYAKS